MRTYLNSVMLVVLITQSLTITTASVSSKYTLGNNNNYHARSNGSSPISPEPQIVTGILLVAALKSAASSIAGEVGANLQLSAGQAEGSLLRIADNLERILGSRISEPIDNLRIDFRTAIMTAESALNSTKDFLAQARACLQADVKFFLAALNSTLTRNVNTIAVWRANMPQIFRAVSLDYYNNSTSLHVMYTDKINNIVLIGANLNSTQACNTVPIEVKNVESGIVVPSNTVLQSSDSEKLVLTLPSIANPGSYKIRVNLRRKVPLVNKCVNIGDVEGFVTLTKKPKFDVTYSVVSTCEEAQTEYIDGSNVGSMKLSLTNDECRGPKIASLNWRIPAGYDYVSHEFIVTSNRGQRSQQRLNEYAGSTVRIQYEVPEREKNIILCTAERNWIEGYLNVVLSKKVTKLTNPIIGNMLSMDGNEARTNNVSSPACNGNIIESTINILYADVFGSTNSLRPFSVYSKAAPVTISDRQFRIVWAPSTRDLSVTTPNLLCGIN